MKIGLSEAAARKTLAMIPCTTNDEDLIQLRTRIEQQLKATTAGGHLLPSELAAVIAVVQVWLDNLNGVIVPGNVHPNVVTALPKLRALLARTEPAGT